MKIKEIPNNERPRERLIKFGSHALSDSEILSIILKTGTYDKSVKELSLEILKEYDISNLKDLTIEKLKEIKGVGEVKAITLLASIELGRRIFLSNNVKNNIKLNNPKIIWEMTKDLFYGKKQEYFYCLYFNNKQELIERKLLFMGTINKSIAHPREIFKEAYLCSASNIVCIHNHPSGDVKPSEYDRDFTRRLVEIGRIQSIPVVDHIIVSDNRYYSFRENKDIFII